MAPFPPPVAGRSASSATQDAMTIQSRMHGHGMAAVQTNNKENIHDKRTGRAAKELDFTHEIRTPQENEPLAEMFLFLSMIQDNLRRLDEQRKHQIDELDQRVRERTADLEEEVKTIEAQSGAILELSTPVIEAWDDILVLPLIGTIDTARTQQIIDHLLDSIARTQASVVIMDITGVPVVDTKVADHLLKSVEAA